MGLQGLTFSRATRLLRVVWWLAFLLMTGLLLWPRLSAMIRLWTADGLYSFCFLVPPTSILLAWKRRKRISEAKSSPSAWGLALGFSAVGLTLFLDISGLSLNFLTPVLLIGILAGAIWALYGFAVVRLLAFPLLFLLMLLPVPPVLIEAIDYPLQTFCARVTLLLATLVGIPAHRSGATIYLPNFTMGIAPACNGLRSSLTLLALAILLCYLSDGSWKAKLSVVALAVPLAYLANFFRLLTDAVVVNALGPRFLMYEHTWDLVWGFLTFLIASLLLLSLARSLKCAKFRSIT